MIDWEKSAEHNGMSVEELKAYFKRYPGSDKQIFVICDECGKKRWVGYDRYCDLCHACAMIKLNLPTEQIIIEYNNGMSTIKLGKKYGCDSAAIYQRLKKNNVKIRSRSEAQILNLPIDQIIIEYNNGINTIELGKKYNCSPATVNKNLKNNGIKIRSNSEAQKKYYESHPEAHEEMSERMKKYYEDNPEAREEASKKSIEQWSDQKLRDEMSKIKKKYYEDHPEAGKEHSERHKKYYEDNPNAKQEYTKKMKKYWSDPEWCIKMSCIQLGITREEWDGFKKSYCDQWTEELREHIRDKYDRKCFICGMTEEDNGVKLSVHHVDYNKQCGCDGTECRLVPLCIKCHSHTTFGDREMWEEKIMCMIEEMLMED